MNQPIVRLRSHSISADRLAKRVEIRAFYKSLSRWLNLLPLLGCVCLQVEAARSQSIVPARDGTNTTVAPHGNTFNIGGGQLSIDRANLFHSFEKFGLNPNQIANFLADPQIRNILGRVTGGDPSLINGSIRVSGANANLFLINPAGIVFGVNARLDLNGSFTATTANGIGFGSNWFNAAGANNFRDLVGDPSLFGFSPSAPGSIVNGGELQVGQGQNLHLFGGTVVNTGSVSAPGGRVIVSSVPGTSLIRFTQPGSLLSFEIQPLPTGSDRPRAWNSGILSLPQLLTATQFGNANKLTVNPDGTVQLSGSGLTSAPIYVRSGDVVAGNITAGTARLSAQQNLTAVSGKLNTTGDLNIQARDTVRIRDTAVTPFLAKAGGNLTIQGNFSIDILALNSPTPAFQSGQNLSLISDGIISGDAHFAAGGNFSILNLRGKPGNFVSLYDPIIRSNGDVTFGNYTGAALKVEAVGNITGGDIAITQPDTTSGIPSSDPDFTTLTTSNALILRAGLTSVSPTNLGGGSAFTSSGSPSPQGNIAVGNIKTSTSNSISPYVGPVELQAKGNISTGNIDTSVFYYQNSGGNVSLLAGGDIIFTSIDTSSGSTSDTGGNVSLLAPRGTVKGTGFLNTGSPNPNSIDTSGGAGAGAILIQHGGGTNNSPFIVGDAATNGTRGNIVASSNSITSTRAFPVKPNGGSDVVGNITIASVNAPPTISANTPLNRSNPSPTKPIEFTYEDLKPNVQDADGDNTSVRVDGVLTGQLKLFRNGTEIPLATSLNPGDRFEYTPPINSSGAIKAFRLVASDGVSLSTPQEIAIAPTIRIDPGVDISNPTKEPPKNPPSVSTNPVTKNNPDDKVTRGYNKVLDIDKREPLSIAQKQDLLLSIEKATGVKPAIIYATFRDYTGELDLVLVTGTGATVFKPVGARKDEVLKIATDFREMANDQLNDDLKPAQQMYQWMVKPLAAELKTRGIKNLLFITDEGLRSVPLAAMHDGKQYLVENYSVGFAPSLRLMDARYTDIKKLPVVAMGASKFQELPSLPAVPAELSAISNESAERSYLNDRFTLDNIKSLSARYRIVHFATHGKFTAGDNRNSYIQLWGNQKLRFADLQQLELYEIPGKRPPTELFVLSACQSALGDKTAELGFGGLAAKTGAKTVLASLWKVDDAGTLGLMSEFYHRLRTAPIKAEALRQAQLAMIKGQTRIEKGRLVTADRQVNLPAESPEAKIDRQDLKHPYYWSAFTMIGNPW